MFSREFLSLEQAQAPFFAGIDLGGTNIKAGIVDDLGRSLSYAHVKSEIETGPENGAQRMADAVRSAASNANIPMDQIAYIGLATPGTMDIPSGLLLNPVNLPGWQNFPIRDRVAHHAERPVQYANDAGAAAYGEFWVGSGSQFHSIILLTLGTGVGGGIIIGDLSVDGENSHGAECGHMIVDIGDEAAICNCGQRGHLEAYASATAVIRRTSEALDRSPQSIIHDRIKAGEELTPLLVHQTASQGDRLAMDIILETARYLGIGITSLLHILDPAAVVLGGAMNFGGRSDEIGQQFLQRICDEVRDRAFPVIAERITIDFASLGGDAGYIGAAGIARLAYLKHV